jgi:CDP-glycerol glycerophosphotransferase (TagB/SpsB family)
MKCVFYLAKHYAVPIFKPLVTYARKNSIDFRFFVSRKIREDFPDEWDSAQILADIKDSKAFNPDFVLSPGNYVDFRIPGIKVQIFHGLGIEKPAHYMIRHFYDLYLTSGPVVTSKFLQLRKRYREYFEVRETGWPKIDYIVNYPAESVRKHMDIPEDKKIILYAPTFSNKMESASQIVSQLESILSPDEFWLIKFHEFMDASVIEEFRTKAFTNARIVETNDITPYLHASDIMVSDTSSVIYEFMALGKPVITINTLSRSNKGFDVKNSSQLKGALQKLKNNPHQLDERIKQNMEDVNPYLDGSITGNVFKALREIMQEGILPKKNKPKNLFRKLKIIYYSIMRKGYLK